MSGFDSFKKVRGGNGVLRKRLWPLHSILTSLPVAFESDAPGCPSM